NLEGYRSEKRTVTSDLNREVDVNLLKDRTRHATKSAVVAKPGEAKPEETKPPETKPEKPVAKPAETKPDKPADPDKELIPAQL
ncbi:MAG TPA: trans-sialidase, partial [Polyangia bacterium]